MKIIIAIKHTGSQPQDRWALQQALSEVQSHHDTVSRPTICVITLGALNQQHSALYDDLPIDESIHLNTTDSLDALHICELLLPLVTQKQPDLLILSPELCSMAQQTGKLLATLLYQHPRSSAMPFNRNQMRVMVIREMHSGAHTVLLPDLTQQTSHDMFLLKHQAHCASGYMAV